ncbi:hypothetical protein MUK42_02657 [Musa troglodytarum]|uniref:Uncharacterized protein n=1 Tax=Musa troglodytarum TaxID=320322 RepID=A0A9E7KUH7_9LILI|nr:hypothetical protein MUK42_02657 [Musa troglodytarum]
MVLRGRADGASEASMALDMDGNIGKVEGVGALCCEDWHLLAHIHMVD